MHTLRNGLKSVKLQKGGGRKVTRIATNINTGTINVAAIYADYANLTISNFLLVVKQIYGSCTTRVVTSGTAAVSASPSLSAYNPSTGTLTVSGNSATGYGSSGYVSVTVMLSLFDLYVVE